MLAQQKRQEDNTESRILEAARELFVRKGFAATSISDIAKEAKINQSLIYHYFVNKQELWREVKKYVLQEYGNIKAVLAGQYLTLSSFLKDIITERYNIYENNPDIARMLLWQKLEENSTELSGGTSASPDLWYDSIVNLQARGEIRSSLDPHMIIAFIANSISGMYTQEHLSFTKDPELRKKYVDMIIDCLIRSLGCPKASFEDHRFRL